MNKQSHRPPARPDRLLVLGVSCLLGLAPSSFGQASASDVTIGQPGVPEAQQVMNFRSLAAQEAAHPTPSVRRLIPAPRLGPGRFAPLPPGTPRGAGRRPKGAQGGQAFSPLPTDSFPGLGDDDTVIPPDTMGAAGPNHLMVTLNSQVRIQDRIGTPMSTVALDSFWSKLGPGLSAFDPRSLYDPSVDRWFFSVVANGGQTNSALMLGVSDTGDPTGNWHLYQVATDTNGVLWADYDCLGYNKDWVALTVNMFGVASNDFQYVKCYVFDKANLLRGGNGAYTLLQNSNAFTLVPAVTLDPKLATLYLMEVTRPDLGQLEISTITGPVGSEVLTLGTATPTVPTTWGYVVAGNFGPQLGSAQRIECNDSRIQNVVYRNGSLWTTHTAFLPAAAPTHAAVQWYQIDPAGTVIQFGRIEDPTAQQFFAFPSIAVNKNNDALVGYSRFAADQYASGNYSFRFGSDPANTMESDQVLKAGEAPYYKTFGGLENRWGDYSATMTDPADDLGFWTLQEYAAAASAGQDQWGVWWGRILPTPGPLLLLSTNYVVGGNGNGLIDPNECNTLYLVLTNAGMADATTVRATISSATPGVVVMQPFSPYPDLLAGTAATNIAAFRVTTAPSFVCGTPVDFTVVIKSDQLTQTNQLQLATGTPAPTVRFDNATAYLIPDNDPNGVISPIFVSGVTGSVANVTVGLHIVHPSDSDLTLELIAPDGTTNLLAAHAGAGGSNFGLACAPDSSLTFFDDAAPTPIASGFAPFVGRFIPQEPLAVYNGKSGAAVNGIWQLRVVDSVAGNAGSLACWSLVLTPVTCEDGGGQCPGVDLALTMTGNPNPAIIGSNLVYTLTVTNKGPNPAHSVVLTQNLPDSTVFVSATPSQGTTSESRGVVTAALGNLDAGASATVSVVVLPTTAGTITATATVTSVDPELNPADNSATAVTVVFGPVSDLAVSVADAPNPTIVGGPLTYSVTVTNYGPATATGVVLSNTLPASVLVNSATSSQGSVFPAGNTVLANIGTLVNGGSATVTINVTPLAAGTIYATAVATANQPDPLLANNTATVATSVGQAADVGIGIATFPNPVVVNSNLTYQITITNFGPNIATNVVVNDALPSHVTIISTTPSQGTVVQTGNNLIWSAGTLVVSGNAALTVVVQSATPGTLTTTATVTAGQSDPNPANNTATATALVAQPFVSIVPAGATLQTESFQPPDGSIDPGETVTLSFRLRNAGNVSNTNLTATLVASPGVTPVGVTTQFYGLLTPSGLPGARPFTFTASGTNGGLLSVTLQLMDGANPLPPAVFTFPLPQTTPFQNPNYITIPDIGMASPYPSAINVTGVTGTVGRVTATLNNLSHTFVSDIDVLLVGPSGQSTILMSSAGNGFGTTNATLTFDDSAASPVPASDPILSGTYQPAAYNPSPNFPAPAPAGPYPAALSGFAGANPNGTWSLFVVDHSAGDSGHIDNGWSLAITTVTPINRVADLALTAAAAPNPVLVGSALTYTFVVTNSGPNAATGVAFTNVLPANVALVSASASQGVVFTNGATVSCSVGSLDVGAAATVTVLATPTAPGVISNSASVSASEVDLNLANNSASALTTATLPVVNVALAGVGAPNPVVVGSNLTYTFTVANSGPGTALNVVLTDPLPAGVTFLSATSQSGTVSNLNGTVIGQLGDLAAGASANVVVTVAPGGLGTMTNTASVTTFSADSNPAGDSAVVVTTAVAPAPSIVAAGSRLLSQSSSPPNGAIVPGETVTVSFALANVGQLGTSNLVATLLPTGGVTGPSAAQSYGVLAPGGAAVAQAFTFTASGVPGGTVAATLQLTDGPNNLGSAQYVYSLPQGTTFANPTFITIPDHGAATPYPSTVVVSGVTGVVGKATVTLNQVSHSFPNDVNVLLVGPQGQNLILMSGAGGGHPATNLVLTFDDAATNTLPHSDALVSGLFHPTAYKTATVFPRPAPAGPRGTTLSTFNGADPNGTWSLYVFDDTVGDAGSIAGGWSLSLSAVQPVNGAADLSVTATAAPNPVLTGATLIYTVNVANHGPAGATGVVVSNVLSAGASFVAATLSQGRFTNQAGTLVCFLGNLPAGGQAAIGITVTPTVAGSLTTVATVTADQTDLNPADNTASAIAVAISPTPSLLSGSYISSNAFKLTLTGQPAATYILQVSTDLVTWLPVFTNAASGTGVLTYVDFTPVTNASRFYRARWVP